MKDPSNAYTIMVLYVLCILSIMMILFIIYPDEQTIKQTKKFNSDKYKPCGWVDFFLICCILMSFNLIYILFCKVYKFLMKK